MRVPLLAMLVLLVAPAAIAVQYRGTTLSTDGGVTLVLHTEHGDVRAPRTAKDQYGFQDPHISPDGRTVGWLELVPVEGIDGPIPGALVIFRNGKVVRRLDCGVVVDNWAFADDGKAVACATSTLHFITSYVYKLLRVSDGHLLGTFSCGQQWKGTPPKPTHLPPTWVNDGKVPAWVWSIAQECPAR